MSNLVGNKELSFGIDLGIASMGWSVVDIKNNEIVDKGVYLFTEAKKAEDRRNARGSRRRKRRRNHRIERIYKILESKKINFKNTYDSKLLEKRNRAIRAQVDMQDIVNIIFYFARHRGYIPFNDEDNRKSEIVDKLRAEGYLACEIQSKILGEHKGYRGEEFLMKHSDYETELNMMLKEQSKYYKEINEIFIKDITEIINSKRAFWEGPGGPKENQLNKYGRYRTKEDLEEYRKDNNYHKYLFEELIGNCSVYANEKKASAWNFYAEYFNFYNDMVNLRINVQDLDETNRKFFECVDKEGYKLTNAAISKLKEEVLNSKIVSYPSIFKKLFSVDFASIYGYKKDKEGKAQLAKFEQRRAIKNKMVDDNMVNMLFSNMKAYNKAIDLIQVSPNVETRYEILKDKLSDEYSEKLLEILSNCKLDNRYHKFSEKALKIYLELMEQYNQNSSYVERNYQEYIKSDVESTMIEQYIGENIKEGNLKYINAKYVEDIIASPATKKSLRKAISILNRLFSKYGYPAYICIENTRELLSTDKQKEYEAKTLDNQMKRKKAKNKLEEGGYEINEANINKYLLLEETNFKCAYCNKDITVGNCEIEHILPISKTANDTFLNKTVACTKCNANKGNKTPYEYLSALNLYSNFEERIKNNGKMVEAKKQNLLFSQNLNKYEKSFKNRNLNDTAYATNELANQIKLFTKAYIRHNYGEILDTKVLKVPGQFTKIMRDRANIIKNRDLQYHHAVDATILASIPKLRIGQLMNMVQNEPNKFWQIDNLNDYREKLYEELYLIKSVKDELQKADYSNTRMAREVHKVKTGQLFDANISKLIVKDGKYYKIEQIDNIYEIEAGKKIGDFKKDFYTKHFLCQDTNPELYTRLCQIVEAYKGIKINAFLAYCKENNMKEDEKFDYRKHGIKQNDNSKSAAVKSLRYLTKINTPYILDTKKLVKSKKKNKNEILLTYDSMKSYCTRIYKDKETGKLYFMPIYKIFIDNNSGKIRTDLKYYKIVFNTYVGKELNEVELYMDLYNDEYVRFETNKGEISEGFVSGFDKTNKKITIKNSALNITTNTKSIEKIKFDVLGLYNLNI